jgi:hypothetical protein
MYNWESGTFEENLKYICEDSWLTEIRHYLPSAWIGHAPFMKFLIRELKPKVFVELGTHNGFSYFVGCQSIQELNLQTKTFAVDHWLGDSHAGKFNESVYQLVSKVNNEYSNFSTLLKMTFSEARAHFENHTVDLLHIDGYHTYEAVKEDFETWLPKVAKNGVIILHDIHVRHADFGVFRFWEEIKKEYETIEFVGTYGLGVIFLGNSENSALAKIREFSKNGDLSPIQGVFACLSDVVIQNFREVENSHLRQQINTFNSELDLLQLQIDKTARELSILVHSKSWRWTAPLRNFMSKFRR